MNKLRIVISAVNITEGGPLTVLRECIESAVEVLPVEFELIVLVNCVDLIKNSNITFLSYPSSKRSWLNRLYWEWFGFRRLSQKLKPALWLSLHDMTPFVISTRQAVYCHNPSPFYRINLREAYQEPKFLVFNLLYKYLYRILIHRNDYVIVQQQWLRSEFIKQMGEIPVVVAYPSLRIRKNLRQCEKNLMFVFIYPAFPRVFKNIETLCKAAQILSSRGIGRFEVRLTIKGNENSYSRWLYKQFASVQEVKFIGRQSEKEMLSQYSESSAVVFPSKLETWGLPITEAKTQCLPLLVADLPYARETVGSYDLVSFFPAESDVALAELMQSMIKKSWQPHGNNTSKPSAPFAPDWANLWGLLTDGLNSLNNSKANNR